jgi:D-alanyl-lipoteichoic acid acyltransferase DltB (MBOAT superfamily)
LNTYFTKVMNRQDGTSAVIGDIDLKNYLAIIFQLGIVALLLRQLQIESAAFLRLALLAFGGFAIHALLPLRYRLSFFLMLSLAGIVVSLDIVIGVSIIAIGLMLIVICHLPVSFKLRGILLLSAGAFLAALRAKWIDGWVSDAVWPILGSMFMFRLIVYFYELRHDKSPTSPVQTLSYFFMLPNACFPLFPVIDYKTFKRNYYDDDAYRIYQIGIDWIVRGIIHLVLYRLVYYHLTLAPSEVIDPARLMQYLAANFLLYLRVSGLFHLIIGMLYLFGFRLPETHNRYLLASSFTDFWRRINIYWKEFMQKIFYYPAVFKLRKLGTTQSMVVATLYVFMLTWLLHAYQWFWLRGTTLLVVQDVLFWAILGMLVVLNALYEIKHGRRRSLGKSKQTLQGVCIRTLKGFATFWFICVLWSFWTSETLPAWFSLWSALGGEISVNVLIFPGVALAVIFLGNLETSSVRNTRSTQETKRDWLRTRLATAVSVIVLLGIGLEGVHTQFGNEVATMAHSLRSSRLSRLDTAKLERGYYENLLSVDRFNSRLWEVYTKKPVNWLDTNAGLKRFTNDFAQSEMIPSVILDTNYGTISINRWGMRDQDYELAPPPGTYRIAMLGASSVMGWGVGDGQTFEALVETRLNHEQNHDKKYEILNLGVQGYQPLQQLVALDKALGFKPHALFYIAAGREISRASYYLVEAVQKNIDIPYSPLRNIVAKAELTQKMEETTALKQIEPYRKEILSWTYHRIAEQSRQNGAIPVLVFLPQVREGSWQEETAETLRIAEDAGFIIIDLSDVYKGQDIATIRLAEWDDHPNVRGHALIADRLYDELNKKRGTIFESSPNVMSDN